MEAFVKRKKDILVSDAGRKQGGTIVSAAGKRKKGPVKESIATLSKALFERKGGVSPVSRKDSANERVPGFDNSERQGKTAGSGKNSPAERSPDLSAGFVRRSGKRNGISGLAFSESDNSPALGPRYFFHSDVPEDYQDTYMGALVRDPEWIFVYWEVSESTMSEIKNKAGVQDFLSAKKILRLIDVTDIDYDGSNAGSYTDVQIDQNSNSWYARAPEPGRTYVVECGFLTASGRFFVAVRSNRVSVPRTGVSTSTDKEWLDANTNQLIRASSGGFDRPLGSSERRPAMPKAGETGELFRWANGSGSGMGGAWGSSR